MRPQAVCFVALKYSKLSYMADQFQKSLIDNAFDFLETAISQFNTQPKYSVINFCAAVELILKARLLHEHWSLIVSAKDPDLRSFKSGNFKSLAFKELIPRIEAVTTDTFHKDAVKCFNDLANHRNKMIHFFHEAQTEKASKQVLESIAVEQCNGWFFLRRLLEKWSFLSKGYEPKINSVNYSMKTHEIYLDTVFERIKPEIDAAKKAGATFGTCQRCHKAASEETNSTANLCNFKCRVCLLEGNFARLNCPTENCTALIRADEADHDDIRCNECHETVSKNEIREALDTNPVTQDNYFEHTTKNCVMCSEMGSVYQHHDYYICKECFYITKDIAYCEWCNESQIGGGDLEFSYHRGCEFCDGYAGHMRDD